MDNLKACRIAVSKQSLAANFNNLQAAQLLERSVRQVQRLKRRPKKEGASLILYSNRGKQPQNTLPEAKQAEILRLATHEHNSNIDSDYQFCYYDNSIKSFISK